MQILLATNDLQDFGGSELIVYELARYFSQHGHSVTIYANWKGDPFGTLVEQDVGVTVVTDPSRINVFEYDLVYFQHQVAGLFRYEATASAKDRTTIAVGRLSRRSFMESGGWMHDETLADVILANSALTAEHLGRIGVSAPIRVFSNAAPAEFHRANPRIRTRLGRILLVSNHRDPTLMEAKAILGKTCDLVHVGRSGNGQRLVTPDMIDGADLVISIGKSVPYALAGRTPVYVHDHNGGPGYLNEANFASAARCNFAGGCCERRLSGVQLADDIVRNYEAGVRFSRDLGAADLAAFYLPNILDDLLRMTGGSNAHRLELMTCKPFMAQERMLCAYVRENTIAHRLAQQQLNRKAVRSIAKTADLLFRLRRTASRRFVEQSGRRQAFPSHSITAL